MRGQKSASQHSGEDHQTPQSDLSPIAAKEFDFARSNHRTELTKAARATKRLNPDDLPDRVRNDVGRSMFAFDDVC
jgi:hypothetical protein